MTNILKRQPPLPENEGEEIFSLWDSVFGAEERAIVAPVFRGEETQENCDSVYTVSEGGSVIATLRSTRSRRMPEVAALGGMAVHPGARGRGLAGELFSAALADLDDAGVCAVYLGTSNPSAAGIYSGFGFSFLPGSNVMARLAHDKSYHAFEKRYFSGGEVKITLLSPADRVPLIPLLLSRSGRYILDGAARVFSSEFVTQTSCEGLYPRYTGLCDKNALVFTAVGSGGETAGIVTALPSLTRYILDGFAHPAYDGAFEKLLYEARYAVLKYGRQCFVPCAERDAKKREQLIAMGMSARGEYLVPLLDTNIRCELFGWL